MEIVKHPNEMLRNKSTDVSVFDDLLKSLVNRMTEAMYVENGVGIAAPQLGINRRLIIVDPSGGDDATKHMVLANPKIVASVGRTVSIEGCLSIPGVSGKVERFLAIEVEYQDLEGQRQRLSASGPLSIIIQHEIDHLDGILFIDKIKEVKRLTSKEVKHDAQSA